MIGVAGFKISVWLHSGLRAHRLGLRWLLAVALVSQTMTAQAMDAREVVAIGNRIVAAVESVRPYTRAWHWTVTLTPNPAANATYRPYGHLIVNRGLLQKMHPTDNQMAFILAHEAVHQLNRDILRNMQFLRHHPYDHATYLALKRREEYRADRGGIMLMARAGYDPRAAVYALLRFSEAWNADPFADDQFMDHPDGNRRIASLRQAMPRALWLYTHRNQGQSSP